MELEMPLSYVVDGVGCCPRHCWWVEYVQYEQWNHVKWWHWELVARTDPMDRVLANS